MGLFKFSPLRVMLTMGVTYRAFIELRYVSPESHFLLDFDYEGVGNFVKGFYNLYLLGGQCNFCP